ncbi:uncharacterized protein LOC132757367 [Ruditapes philippinarum]|uniref:uncharacterized protein LOC132757367 n=1 Tax=Ruditapes philippinarum TaxID=129788 RepID=UPI00295AEEFC|nr:uncharacterized protein LOC132757367 [Ruditapes philippinarum]
MILFIIFIWTSFLQDSFGYILSEGRISWLEAAKIQKFATPDIFSLKSFTNLLEDGGETWVGYFQMNTAFAYVGCTSIDGHPHVTFSSIHKNSPGLCLTFCKRMKMARSIVGLSRDKCLCLRMLPSRDLHKTGCHLQNSVWVAGDGDKLMSIYEKKDIFGSGGTNDVQCLAFHKYSSSASWNGCRQYKKCLCKAKGNI